VWGSGDLHARKLLLMGSRPDSCSTDGEEQHCDRWRCAPMLTMQVSGHGCAHLTGRRSGTHGQTLYVDFQIWWTCFFCCPLCSATFTRSADVRRHISAVHEKQKLFVCPACAASFTLKVSGNWRMFLFSSSRGDAAADFIALLHCCCGLLSRFRV
jgi:hypothetical protein